MELLKFQIWCPAGTLRGKSEEDKKNLLQTEQILNASRDPIASMYT